MHRKPISVVLIDPHPLFRRGVREHLGQDPGVEIVDEGATGADAIRLVRKLSPDIALISYRTPDLTGDQVLRELRREETRLVFLTDEQSPSSVLAAMLNGASGYIMKASEEDLLRVVREAAAGKLVMCSNSIAAMIGATREMMRQIDSRDYLSDREREILTMVSEGVRRATIARELNISPHTVKNHLAKIYRKLEVGGSAAAVSEGHRRKLI